MRHRDLVGERRPSTKPVARHSCQQIVAILREGNFAPQVFGAFSGEEPAGATQVVLRGAVADSREAGPGLVFVARRGERQDGHSYIQAAYEQGCRYFLVERAWAEAHSSIAIGLESAVFIAVRGCCDEALYAWARAYRQSLRHLYVLALSGSHGKTSTKELLALMLARRYRCHATAGNRNAPVGCALTLLGLSPEAEVAVLELGIDHPGEMDLLCSLAQPNAALLTGIGSAHLGGFGSRKRLASEKGRIYSRLQAYGSATKNSPLPAAPVALLPAADAFYRVLRDQLPAGCRVLDYSAQTANEEGYRVEDRGLEGLRFNYLGSGNSSGVERLHCDLKLLGLHAQQVFWAAAAAAQLLGLSPAEIFAGAHLYKPLSGRGELQSCHFRSSLGTRAVTLLQDCYNASPESLYALIEMLQTWRRQDILPPCVLVLGDMRELGSASREYHRRVAELLQGFAMAGGKRRETPNAPQALAIILYGSEMSHAWQALQEVWGNSSRSLPFRCRYVSSNSELEAEAALAQVMTEELECLPAQSPTGMLPLLALKGARAMHLEKIVQKILL